MKESLFSKLFSYRDSENVSPRENYLTEIFAYCLLVDGRIREIFFEWIGVKPTNDFSVETQNRYEHGIPDIEIRLPEISVLIECKIEQNERHEQLPDYAKILLQRKDDRKILIYLTKYYDPKEFNNENIEFHHFRWHQIFELLNASKSFIATQLQKYLTEQGMSQDKNFSSYDLVALQTITSSISKMDEVLDGVQAYFTERFGKFSKDSSRSTRLKDGKYINYRDFFLPNHELGIQLGFGWHWEDGHTYLYMSVWGFNKLESSKMRKKELAKLLKDWEVWDFDKWWELGTGKKITEFFSEQDQVPKMVEFLKESIDELYSAKQAKPELFGN